MTTKGKNPWFAYLLIVHLPLSVFSPSRLRRTDKRKKISRYQRDILRPRFARLVHAAAAEALQIERDIHIAQLLQPRDDPLALLQHNRQLSRQHLQAGDRVVVAH